VTATEKLSASLEDYLSCIYRLAGKSNGMVRIAAIAGALGCSKPSACRATDVLAGMGLLTKHRYKGFTLTAAGIAKAEALHERFGLLCRFLTDILKLDPASAERDACGLEHAVSADLYSAIARYLLHKGD
jgi:DtxR family Mn-dependent transcriptional regulator